MFAVMRQLLGKFKRILAKNRKCLIMHGNNVFRFQIGTGFCRIKAVHRIMSANGKQSDINGEPLRKKRHIAE